MNLSSTYTFLFVDEPSDPRVIEWPMMADPFLTIIILIIYLLIVTVIGPRFMENRKPYNLKTVIRSYNLFQIISSGYLFYKFGAVGWFTGELSFGCTPLDKSDNPVVTEIARLMWWIYIVKIIELIETIFFVLRKKYNQVSFLHMYHHTSTVLCIWGGVKYIPGVMSSLPCMINCFVHFVMYGYYFLSTLGPEWQKKLDIVKNKLTMLQMIQFVIVIAYISQVLRDDCDFPGIVGIIFVPNVLLIFYMFYEFYKKAYSKKTQ